LKAILANDNLNQPHVIADEIRKLAGDVPHAIVSATWQNPPSFPPAQLAAHARTNRGMQMLFIAGDVEAHVMAAPFLTANSAQPDGHEPNMEAAASELMRKYKLSGPQTRNLLFGLPRAPFLDDRLRALGRDSASVIMPVGELSPAHTRSYVATVNGSARTNEPIAILLTGLFDREELFSNASTDIATAGVYAPGFLVRFGENRLVSTFDSIGELGIKILEEAREAEIFRLWSMFETAPANATQLDDYRIKKVGAKGGPDVARTLADEILAPGGGGSGGMTACLLDPGLAFRVSTADGAVSAVVCFNCGQIHFVVRDRDGKEVHRGMRYIEVESKTRLAKAGLKGLPGDRALIKITDHAR
jgi:hypothetical protein